MEDLDDLITNILQDKPQAKKPGAFSLDTPKKPEKVKEKKKRRKLPESRKPISEEEVDESELALTYKRVPNRKRNPYCGTCRAKLKGGTWHWYYKDDSDEIWWWCSKCMAAIDCIPNEKEKALEQSQRNSRN